MIILTQEQIDEMIRLYNCGGSSSDIAKRFGISRQTVNNRLRKSITLRSKQKAKTIADVGICCICGGPSVSKRARNKPPTTCSMTCYREWRRRRMVGNKYSVGHRPPNAFPVGHNPWNKNLKGIHLSPESEFKPGPRPDLQDPIGSVKVRNHKGGTRRSWIKTDEKTWQLNAVVVWESANGKVPKGSVVHHKDRNPLNDFIDNLQCMTRAEHAMEHLAELHLARAKMFEENRLKNIQAPLADSLAVDRVGLLQEILE